MVGRVEAEQVAASRGKDQVVREAAALDQSLVVDVVDDGAGMKYSVANAEEVVSHSEGAVDVAAADGMTRIAGAASAAHDKTEEIEADNAEADVADETDETDEVDLEGTAGVAERAMSEAAGADGVTGTVRAAVRLGVVEAVDSDDEMQGAAAEVVEDVKNNVDATATSDHVVEEDA